MKKRVIRARAREVVSHTMPTCLFNAMTTNFVTRPPVESYRAYCNQLSNEQMAAIAIRNGQKALPRRAKEWQRRIRWHRYL